jgi:glyoxylase-like metal-dependent hydrolase (beta-lactamase superfamily II)
MKKMVAIFILTVFFFTITSAQIKISFVVKKITNYIYIVHPQKVNRVNNTSTIILSPGYLTVVESQTDEFMATELIKAIRSKISRLPIKYLINTHFHLDHVLGTNAFVKENPSIVIITHELTAKIMEQKTKTDKDQLAASLMQKAISTRKQAGQEKNKEKRSELLTAANDIEKYSKDLAASTIIFPTVTFRDSLTIWDNRLHIQLKFLGGGHTPGDIVLLIPEEKFLITGDLVHDFEPLFWDADIDNWLLVLDKIKSLDFDYFVGGHGDVHKGKEIIDFWKEYIEEVKTKTIKAVEDGVSLTDFQKSLSLESFTSLQMNDYGKRIQQFRSSYMSYVMTGSLLVAIRGQIDFVWKYYQKKPI